MTTRTASTSNSSRADANQVHHAGLTVVVEPEEPTLDVVFVHGFTGHPERTWTSKGTKEAAHKSDTGDLERPSKFRRLFNSNSSSTDRFSNNTIETGLYWPKDLVPDTLLTARVLTYGYDTHIRHVFSGPVSQNTLYDHATDFLAALEAERRGAPSRSLILVAHSLGGLLVKEALRRSRGYDRLAPFRRIFESTIGIIFFGTPYNGADPRSVAHHAVISLAKGIGFRVNEKIVDSLFPSAEYLKQLRDEFRRMIEKREWLIHSFQEQYGMSGLFGKKVVKDDSSYVDHPKYEIVQHIDSNHKDMCRFSGSNDPEYHKVASALQRIAANKCDYNTEFRQIKIGLDTNFNPTQARREELMMSLKFDQLESRFHTVGRAHSKTCQWLRHRTEYKEWLGAQFSDPRGFLWIKGKPGVGKSTIMKFALSQVKKTLEKETIVIQFFFNARGAELERSTVGLYRSLLFQLLQAVPKLQRVLDTAPASYLTSGAEDRWHVQILQDLFRSSAELLKAQSLVCFVDALDECHEDEVRDMISHLQDLGDLAESVGFHLRVCFSSRHYPYISVSRGVSLVLESQEEHNQDIMNYIASELHIGDGRYVPNIREQIQEKSSGIFLWTVLVVRILNKQYDRGDIAALQKRLSEIPRGLSELFEDILTRDCENIQSLLLCIRWVLFATRPLTREELYFAIIAGHDSSTLQPWDKKLMSIGDMGRYILTCSKGLTEMTKTHHVQFIHESVRDFLLKENGLGKIWPEMQEDFEAKSHDTLKECCNFQLEAAKWCPCGFYPFLKYAVLNIFRHANTAHCLGQQQNDFFVSFDVYQWIKLSNALERYPVRRYTSKVHLLYILADYNAPWLASIHPEIGSHHQLKGERYGSPLYAALAKGYYPMVKQLLSVSAELNPCKCRVDRNLQDLKDLAFKHAIGSQSDQVTLIRAIDGGCYVTFHALLHLGFCNIESINGVELQALVELAVKMGGGIFFLILLTHSSKPGEKGEWRRELLSIAESSVCIKSGNFRKKRIKAAEATSLERAHITRGCIEILKTMINSGHIIITPNWGLKSRNWWKVLVGEAVEV